jgi:hypothetical protein
MLLIATFYFPETPDYLVTAKDGAQGSGQGFTSKDEVFLGKLIS